MTDRSSPFCRLLERGQVSRNNTSITLLGVQHDHRVHQDQGLTDWKFPKSVRSAMLCRAMSSLHSGIVSILPYKGYKMSLSSLLFFFPPSVPRCVERLLLLSAERAISLPLFLCSFLFFIFSFFSLFFFFGTRPRGGGARGEIPFDAEPCQCADALLLRRTTSFEPSHSFRFFFNLLTWGLLSDSVFKFKTVLCG